MLRARVIPCLLLMDGRLVKTIKFKNPNYVGDPINIVRIFNTKEVDELVFLDISATISKREPQINLIQEIASECGMPLAYGGGIRSLEVAKKILNMGVEKVILNSFAVENPSFISHLANSLGSQSIIVSIDVKKSLFGKYSLYTHSGQTKIGVDPVDYAVNMEKNGAGEILLTAIDRDGTMQGYDSDLIKMISQAVNIPVIASGGASNISDLVQAIKISGASAVAAGSMFFYQGRNRAILTNFPTKEELNVIN